MLLLLFLVLGCPDAAGTEEATRFVVVSADQLSWGNVVVLRDRQTGLCHGVWSGTYQAASLGVVPCTMEPGAPPPEKL